MRPSNLTLKSVRFAPSQVNLASARSWHVPRRVSQSAEESRVAPIQLARAMRAGMLGLVADLSSFEPCIAALGVYEAAWHAVARMRARQR